MGFLLRCGGAGSGELRVEEPRALRTFARAGGGHALVVHGDLLDRGFALPPPDLPAERMVAVAGRAFARHCGVLVRDGTAALWSDHGALHPLHYARDVAGVLVVGTSAAALLPLLTEPAGLTTGLREPGRTGFTGVSAVPPGTLLTLPVRGAAGPAAQHSTVYFGLPEPAESMPAEHAVGTVGAALADAVTSQLADLTSAGMLLSGGVDSSTVAALAAQRLGTLRTYTVGTPYGNEFAAARRLVEHLGSEHEELTFTPPDLAALLPRMVQLLETWDLTTLQIVAPICFVLDRLRGREPVLLTGYGADLLFAGLGGAGSDAQTELATRRGVLATGCSNEFSPAFAEASGILIRHPYWTASMISTALSVPAALKLRDGTVKWVLRQAAARVIPPDVAFRKKIAIQEGTAMHRMFAAVLETEDPAVQAERLHELAGSLFAGAGTGDGTAELAATTPATGRQEAGNLPEAGHPPEEGTHARLVGVAS